MCGQVTNSLFQSIPPPYKEEAPKGFLDHCATYLTSLEGSRDLFDVISHVSRAFELFSSPLSEASKLATQVKDLFELSGLSLSVPSLVVDMNTLDHSLSRLFAVSCGHTMQTVKAIKDVAMQALLLLNTGTRGVLFAQGSKILSLTARQIVRVNLIASVASFITDGSDLIRDCLEWQVEGKSKEADNLAFMNVVKNLSSVAVSALMLFSYASGMALAEPLIAGSIFALGTVYLVSKISGYFYKKMVVEGPLGY